MKCEHLKLPGVTEHLVKVIARSRYTDRHADKRDHACCGTLALLLTRED